MICSQITSSLDGCWTVSNRKSTAVLLWWTLLCFGENSGKYPYLASSAEKNTNTNRKSSRNWQWSIPIHIIPYLYLQYGRCSVVGFNIALNSHIIGYFGDDLPSQSPWLVHKMDATIITISVNITRQHCLLRHHLMSLQHCLCSGLEHRQT